MEPKTKEPLIRNQSLKLNALSNWATFAVSTIVAFLVTPFVVRHLGKTGYGIWALVGSFTGYYGLLNLGVDSAITRYIARYAAQGDKISLNETASTAITMFCGTGILVAGLAFVIAEPLAKFFEVAPSQVGNFRQVVQVMGIATGLTFPASAFSGIVRAHEKFVVANCVTIAMTVSHAVLVVFLLLSDWGLSGVAFASLTRGLLTLAVSYSLCKCLTPHIHIRLAFIKWSVLRTLVAYGSITTVIVAADLMRGAEMDNFIVGKWVGLSAVGVYAIASSIRQYISQLVVTGMGVLTPRFAALDGAGDQTQLRRLLLKALSVSAFLSFGGCMMAIIFGKQFILWWVGEDFADATVILWILTVGTAFAVSQNPTIGFLYALNKHYVYAIATVIEGAANLTLSILLVQRYGMIGVAFGTLIPLLFVKVLVMPLYAARIAGLSVWDYLVPFVPPLTVGAAMTMAAYCAGIMTRSSTSITYLIAAGVVAGMVYVTACFLIMRWWKIPFVLAPACLRRFTRLEPQGTVR